MSNSGAQLWVLEELSAIGSMQFVINRYSSAMCAILWEGICCVGRNLESSLIAVEYDHMICGVITTTVSRSLGSFHVLKCAITFSQSIVGDVAQT